MEKAIATAPGKKTIYKTLTTAEVTARTKEATAYLNEQVATQWKRDRENLYAERLGGWQDQLDMIYHDMAAWKSAVKAIKTEVPKPV